MLWLGIALIIIGAVLAALLDHTIGAITATLGLILVIVALLVVADANAAAAILAR